MATENESDVQKALAALGGAPIQYRSFGQPEVRPTPLDPADAVVEPLPASARPVAATAPEPTPPPSPLAALSPAGTRTLPPPPVVSPQPHVLRPVPPSARAVPAPTPEAVPPPVMAPAAYRPLPGASVQRGRSLPEVFSLLAGRGS